MDLGWAVDSFDCYWNGVPIGTSSKPHYGHSRWVWVNGGSVVEGRNVVAVRLVSHTASDGLWSSSDTWRYKVEVKYPSLSPAAMKEMPTNFPTAEPQLTAGYLFNGLISPLIPFAMRGAIWYQGENNTDDRAPLYESMLTTLIEDWRARWQQGPFPFYAVQLANFTASANWAVVREAQLRVARNLQNCGIAVTVDIGDATDIHPANKLDVGHRLALSALAKDFLRLRGPMAVSSQLAQ